MRPPAPMLALAAILCASYCTGQEANTPHTRSPEPAAITVTDDSGHTLTLAHPAKRVVTLTPHLTEDLFAIGAGQTIVGTTDYSDYPPAAKAIPRIGNYSGFDLERIRALHPDLIVAWPIGNPAPQLQHILNLGIPVYHDNARTLAQIPGELERLGELTGHRAQAQAAAQRWRARQRELERRFSHKAPVVTFMELWTTPLITLNRTPIMADSLRLCGASNPFADLASATPTVDIEGVLAANPQVIVRSGPPNAPNPWLRWPHIRAVAQHHIIDIPPDELSRPGPRMIEGTERLCQAIDRAR